MFQRAAEQGVTVTQRVVKQGRSPPSMSPGRAADRRGGHRVITNEKGIATFERDAKVAYFKDPDGNTLSIAQGGS